MFLVYMHFQAQNVAMMEKQVIKATKKYDSEVNFFLAQTEEKQELFLNKVRDYFDYAPLTRVQLSDVHHKVILDYHKQRYPAQIDALFARLTLSENMPFSSVMLPVSKNNIVLLYMNKIEKDGQPPLYLKIIYPLDSDQIAGLQTGMQKVFAILLITMLLIFITIYPIIFAQYKRLNEDKDMLLKSNLDTIVALGNAIALRDSDTHDHNYRVTYYGIRLAEKLQIPHSLFPSLIKGAFLHDVGKIGIPDAILLKPSSLSGEEFAVMKTHVNLGTSLIKNIDWLKDASAIIGAHHERYDGKGYPLGLSGEQIPLVARIFCIADVFDALTSRRPYKEAWSFNESSELLRSESGTHFDPAVITTFLEIGDQLWTEVNGLDIRALEELLVQAIEPYSAYFQEIPSTTEALTSISSIHKGCKA